MFSGDLVYIFFEEGGWVPGISLLRWWVGRVESEARLRRTWWGWGGDARVERRWWYGKGIMDESCFMYDLVLPKTMSCIPFLMIYTFSISWQIANGYTWEIGEIFFSKCQVLRCDVALHLFFMDRSLALVWDRTVRLRSIRTEFNLWNPDSNRRWENTSIQPCELPAAWVWHTRRLGGWLHDIMPSHRYWW